MKVKANFCNIVCCQHTDVSERTHTTLKNNYRRLSSYSITVARLLIKHDTISGVAMEGGCLVRIIMSGLRTVGTTTLSKGFLPATRLCVHALRRYHPPCHIGYFFVLRLLLTISQSLRLTRAGTVASSSSGFYLLFFVHLALAIPLPDSSAILPFGFSLTFRPFIYLPSSCSRF